MGRLYTSRARTYDEAADQQLASLASLDPATGPVTLTVADLGEGWRFDHAANANVAVGAASLFDIYVEVYDLGAGGAMTVALSQDDGGGSPVTFGTFDFTASTRGVGSHCIPIYNHVNDDVYRYVVISGMDAGALYTASIRKRHP